LKRLMSLSYENNSPIVRRLSGILSGKTRFFVEKKWDENLEVAGSIVLVYDHHKRDLQSISTALQHDYHDLILSVQHVHLDHHHCLETIAVKGKAIRLKELADKLIAIKGMKHGELVMTATQ